MALIDYSASESEEETSQPQAQPQRAAARSTRGGLNRLVDASNPAKIRISLPQETQVRPSDEPPVKRARLGAGGLSGFNAMLPAPKRASTTATVTPVATQDTLPRRGLTLGMNLKTGAEPAFSRAPMEIDLPHKASVEEDPSDGALIAAESGSTMQDTTNTISEDAPLISTQKSTIFRPLSVARKPPKKVKKKKNDPLERPATSNTESSPQADTAMTDAQPSQTKKSLFSLSEPDHPSSTTYKPSSSSSAYQPLLYPSTSSPPPAQNPYLDADADANIEQTPPPAPTPEPETLSSIATALHLTPSARRQLLGKPSSSSSLPPPHAKVLTFDLAAEYDANELLRQSGAAVAPQMQVRALAPGKHSLKQLVNAVSSQREALEDSFAAGRRRKGESGARYGR